MTWTEGEINDSSLCMTTEHLLLFAVFLSSSKLSYGYQEPTDERILTARVGWG